MYTLWARPRPREHDPSSYEKLKLSASDVGWNLVQQSSINQPVIGLKPAPQCCPSSRFFFSLAATAQAGLWKTRIMERILFFKQIKLLLIQYITGRINTAKMHHGRLSF